MTTDDIVKELMEDETLKKIAHELTLAIRNNITIDWSVRKSAQASMRRVIKRLLSKYDYPPDQALKAMNIVMRQEWPEMYMKKLSGQTELLKNLENLKLTDEMIGLHGRNKVRNQLENIGLLRDT